MFVQYFNLAMAALSSVVGSSGAPQIGPWCSSRDCKRRGHYNSVLSLPRPSTPFLRLHSRHLSLFPPTRRYSCFFFLSWSLFSPSLKFLFVRVFLLHFFLFLFKIVNSQLIGVSYSQVLLLVCLLNLPSIFICLFSCIFSKNTIYCQLYSGIEIIIHFQLVGYVSFRTKGTPMNLVMADWGFTEIRIILGNSILLCLMNQWPRHLFLDGTPAFLALSTAEDLILISKGLYQGPFLTNQHSIYQSTVLAIFQ